MTSTIQYGKREKGQSGKKEMRSKKHSLKPRNAGLNPADHKNELRKSDNC